MFVGSSEVEDDVVGRQRCGVLMVARNLPSRKSVRPKVVGVLRRRSKSLLALDSRRICVFNVVVTADSMEKVIEKYKRIAYEENEAKLEALRNNQVKSEQPLEKTSLRKAPDMF